MLFFPLSLGSITWPDIFITNVTPVLIIIFGNSVLSLPEPPTMEEITPSGSLFYRFGASVVVIILSLIISRFLNKKMPQIIGRKPLFVLKS